MNKWKRAGEAYNSIDIPETLADRVRLEIERHERAGKFRRHYKNILEVCALSLVLLAAGLNLSPAFADAAGELPIVGGLFRVMTVRSWHESEEDATVQVDIPGIEQTPGAAHDFSDQMNQEIEMRVQEKIEEGNQAIQEYKEAFLQTGGSQEEWDERENTVSVSYEIKYQNETRVSFVIETYVSIASAFQETFFYNLDLMENKTLTLRDLLGDNWIDLCNADIQRQIEAYPLESGESTPFFDASLGGFDTVDEQTSFYIGQDGNPVVVFPRGSIAIGAMGVVEFIIEP